MRSDTSHRLGRALAVRGAVGFAAILCGLAGHGLTAGQLVGTIVDSSSGDPVASRVYIENDSGEPFTVSSVAAEGTAVVYDVRRGASQEVHTTLSAHPFKVDLPEGRYHLTVERGKEFHPVERSIEVRGQRTEVSVSLKRWIDMAAKGWYSGDTHVHRPIEALPNLLLAEDLNVALPLTYWVTEFNETPLNNSRPKVAPVPKATLIEVDPTYVIWPINTEYEIFTVGRKRHTLGAVFVLNHQEPLDLLAHSVRAVAEEARRQGGILDLDKHNWPWSMMLLPVIEVDLFELTNNHVWRTKFLFSDWYPEYLPGYLDLKLEPGGYSEDAWIRWGFANYYALLNCGFDMMPSGGTASGVHPVPLGFGRVYVYVGDRFDFDRWMDGLEGGQSFVTTGPMLDVRFNGHLPGARFLAQSDASVSVRVEGEVVSDRAIESIEWVVNGEVVKTTRPDADAGQLQRVEFSSAIEIKGSSWVAIRCFSDGGDGRKRFAHSAPVHVSIPGAPLRPRRDEVTYLMNRVKNEILRHESVLPPATLEEYREALRFYQAKLEEAR